MAAERFVPVWHWTSDESEAVGRAASAIRPLGKLVVDRAGLACPALRPSPHCRRSGY